MKSTKQTLWMLLFIIMSSQLAFAKFNNHNSNNQNLQSKNNIFKFLSFSEFQNYFYNPFLIENNDINTDFATSDLFSIESKVIETCYSGNSNTKKIEYILKNISNRSIEIGGESGTSLGKKKIRLVAENIDLSTLNVLSGTMSFTGVMGYLQARTFLPNEEIKFELNYNYSNLSDDVIGKLEFRYGNSTASGTMSNPDIRMNVTNSISKIPTKPNNVSKVINTAGSYQLYTVAELPLSANNYKFYDENNNLIAANFQINTSIDTEQTFYYSQISSKGCESEKSVIILSKTTAVLPQGGTISLSEETIVEQGNICYDKNITILNHASGSGTGGYLVKYSWEASYDNGLTWYLYEEVGGSNSTETSERNKTITLNNLKKSVWLRRKAQEIRINNQFRFSYSNIVKLNVIQNAISIAGGESFSRPLYDVEVTSDDNQISIDEYQNNYFQIPTITTTIPSNVNVYAPNGTQITNGRFYFTTEGTYPLTVVANSTTGGCETYATIIVNVYDLKKCRIVTERIVATGNPPGEGWGTTLAGVVANKENAYDNDLSTHSTISVMLGLLGLGTTWQNIYFDHVVPAGTPMHVKLGQEYSGAQVAGGITIVGLDADGNSIGPIKSVNEGALLDLLTGDNVFEFSFIPTDSRGTAMAYKGVRVILGSLVSVANNAVLYGAYYEKKRILTQSETVEQTPTYIKGAKFPNGLTQVNQLRNFIPNTPDEIEVFNPDNVVIDQGNNLVSRKLKLNDYVSDISWGVRDAGLGVATSLSSIVYPYLAVDDNPFTYAIFNKTVAALNKQVLDVRLKSDARPGDELELIMTSEGVNVLSLDLGADFTVQRYYNDTKVGPVVASNQFKVINLNLFLFKNPVPRFRIGGIPEPFNRVEISYLSGVQANLGNFTYLHDVSIVPQSVFTQTIDVDTEIQLCAADFVKISKPTACTEYQVSFVVGELKETVISEINETNELVTRTISSYIESENQNLVDQILSKVHETNSDAYFDIKRLYTIDPDKVLLLKVQTLQNNFNYGAPQYIRIKLNNCLQSIANPSIRIKSNK